MIKLSFKLCVSAALLAQSVLAMDNVNELTSILERAEMSNSLAAKALHEDAAFRTARSEQFNALREQIRQAQEDQKSEDPEKWKTKVLSKIENDENLAKQLNIVLEPLRAGTQVHHSVKMHKTLPILEGVKTLITNSFFDFLEGRLPAEYAYDQKTVTILGDNTTALGNSRGTFLATALMYMLANKEAGVSKGFGSFGLTWFDASALAHIAPLPHLDLDLSGFSFASPYNEDRSQLALVIPHSGYAFGAHRNQSRYQTGKKYGPHDCSSYLSLIAGSPHYTTPDQLCAYRTLTNEPGLIPQGWETGIDAKYLIQNYTVVTVKDPSVDIQPGQIYTHIRFNKDVDSTMTGLGAGGHTAIVMGFKRDGNIVTMGANRDMPKLEGIGIQNFSWAPEEFKKKMIFNIKDSL
jgi:hypothetical protein